MLWIKKKIKQGKDLQNIEAEVQFCYFT
jgi:hypothetical protein